MGSGKRYNEGHGRNAFLPERYLHSRPGRNIPVQSTVSAKNTNAPHEIRAVRFLIKFQCLSAVHETGGFCLALVEALQEWLEGRV